MEDLQHIEEMVTEAKKMSHTCNTGIVRKALKIGKVTNDCFRRGTINCDEHHKLMSDTSNSIIEFENNCRCKR